MIDSAGCVSVAERQNNFQLVREATIELVIDAADTTNPYLSTFLGGALSAAGQFNAGLLLRHVASIPDSQAEQWAEALARSGTIGVIEVTSAFSAIREGALSAVGLPMVLVDPIDLHRTSAPSVGATNWAGAYEATKHLLGLGHRRVAYIGGPPRANCDYVRAHGWAAAMAEAGIAVDVTAVPRHSYTFAHGLAAAEEMLSSADRPSAVFAGSDVSACGVLEAARRLKIVVPDEMSLVGFDDTYLAHTSMPPLTTVHQPIADIGRTAVSFITRLAADEPVTVKRIELSTHLVVRNSTAPPPH